MTSFCRWLVQALPTAICSIQPNFPWCATLHTRPKRTLNALRTTIHCTPLLLPHRAYRSANQFVATRLCAAPPTHQGGRSRLPRISLHAATKHKTGRFGPVRCPSWCWRGVMPCPRWQSLLPRCSGAACSGRTSRPPLAGETGRLFAPSMLPSSGGSRGRSVCRV